MRGSFLDKVNNLNCGHRPTAGGGVQDRVWRLGGLGLKTGVLRKEAYGAPCQFEGGLFPAITPLTRDRALSIRVPLEMRGWVPTVESCRSTSVAVTL